MREIVHLQAGQCGNQIGAKVRPGAVNTARIVVRFLAFNSQNHEREEYGESNLSPLTAFIYYLNCAAMTLLLLDLIHFPYFTIFMFLVLGDHLGRARHRPHWLLRWDLRAPAGEDQCVLQ